MTEWLLILTVMSGFWGSGFPVTDITMHDFPSRELCESAAEQTAAMAKYETTVTYKCLQKSGGQWVEVGMGK